MRKLIALVALVTMLIALVPQPASAHGGAAYNAFLALTAFTFFNALFVAPVVAATRPVYVAPSPAVYESAPAAYTQPAPAAVSREVVYEHGRYVLYGDGVTRAYQWVWIPNPPPPGSAPGY